MSRQTPDTALDVQQQTEVAQNLQLLADFVADMPIIGMQLLQLALEGVGVGGREFTGGTSYTSP
jgi:hypothetical protein